MSNKKKELLSAYDNLNIIDRQKEFNQILYALLMKEHVLLNGKAGTGKSMLAKNVFSLIENADVFSIHMTKFMSEEVVFGPTDIKKLREESIIEYKTENGALTKDFLFLDEFFDASDALLRSLLGILNEREWHKGSQYVKSPLHTAICTSNYTRDNEITNAVLDRFVFKAIVKPIKKRYEKELYTIKNNKTATALSLSELQEMCAIIDSDKIKLTPKIIERFIDLRREFHKTTKKYISDRTARKAIKLLRASAFLNDRKTVTDKDIPELKYLFCTLNHSVEEQLFDTCLKKIFGKEIAEKEAKETFTHIEKILKDFPDITRITKTQFIESMEGLNESLGMLSSLTPINEEMSKKKRDYILAIKDILTKNQEKFILQHTNNDNQ